MLDKIRDWSDTKVSCIILIDRVEDALVLANVMKNIGMERLSYEVYKDTITSYMVEIRMPYNRYLKMMQNLRKNGYNLRPESEVDIIQRLYKE